MYQSFKSLCSIVLLMAVVFSVSVQSSNQAAKKPGRQSDIKKTVTKNSLQKPVSIPQQPALTVLKQLLLQTDSFPNDRYRAIKIVLFQAEVADTLWDYDKVRARALFIAAFKAAGAFSPAGANRFPFADDTDIRVRGKILRFLLNHDTTLAENLVDSISVGSAKPAPNTPYSAAFIAQAMLYLKIANHIAKSDPHAAVRLMKHTMNGWINVKQIQVLQSLRQTSPALADEVFTSLLSTFRDRPTYLTAKIDAFVPYVFPEINQIKPGRQAAVKPAEIPQSSPAFIQTFLAFVYDNVMDQSLEKQINEPNEFGKSAFKEFTMKDLAPYFDRYMPEKAPLYRARIEEISKKLEQAGKREMWDAEDHEIMQLFEMNVEDRLKEAEAADGNPQQTELYAGVIMVLAMRDNEFDRALSIARKITDGHMKSDMTLMVCQEAIKKALESKDTEQAHRCIKEIQKPGIFVDYATQIAAIDIEQNRHEQARQILQEAEKRLPQTDDEDSANSKVRVANVAASLQPEQGFTATQIAVKAINQVMPTSKPATVGFGVGPDDQISFPDRFDYEQGFAILGRVDFDRTLQLANSLQAKEAALLARLAVCKGALRK